MTVCKHAQYKGRVQGVGFRYTVHSLADDFPVAGYVRNLPQGDVEVVAEGEPEYVQAFLAAIDQRMAGYIHECVTQECPPSNHKGFRIRY